MRAPIVTIVLSALWLASCGREPAPTGLYVIVTTDLAVPTEIDGLALTAWGAEMADGGQETRAVPAVDGPLRVLLSPRGAGLALLLHAEVRRDGVAVLSRDVETAYLPGEIRVLTLVLSGSCAGSSCPEECDRGSCVPRAVRPEDLERWTGQLPDAGISPRDGGPDGGIDGGPDGGTDGGIDGGPVGEPCMSGHDPSFCPAPYSCTATATGCELDIGLDALTAGDWHTCAWSRTTTSPVVCWGDPSDGRLGAELPSAMLTDTNDLLVRVPGIELASSVAAGDDFTCAVHDGGRITCWGGAASEWAGGSGMRAELTLPDGEHAREVVAGDGFACTRSREGHVHCWGDNSLLQLGRAGAGSTTPVRIAGPEGDLLGVAAGDGHACAWTASTVWCWGDNRRAQLGMRDVDARVGAQVVGLPVAGATVRTMGLGGGHTCLVTGASEVSTRLDCWGADESGQLNWGTGPGSGYSLTPVETLNMDSIRQVTAGPAHTCVIDGIGGKGRPPVIFCWGASDARLGAMPTTDSSGDRRPTALAAGAEHTCFVAAGTVYCFGANDVQQLGSRGAGSAGPREVLGLR